VTTLAPATEHRSQPDPDEESRRVAYLLGAGATQGAVQFAGSAARLVMPGLIDRLLDRTRDAYDKDFTDHAGLRDLVNDVVDARTDFEHLLTFLADTPSKRYQEFAERLKLVFSTVLREALADARTELGNHRSGLYAALLDMHEVVDSGEHLVGFLTLNYDDFLERAIEQGLGRTVDYGVQLEQSISPHERAPIPVLKLHGSFSWHPTWPLEVADESDAGLWIPPGIRKAKGEYPFNAIWGRARELLDCDVVRIIGCNLGSNDWDLVSLLFTTMHGRESARPYEVEVIGWPDDAAKMSEAFPYLDVRSLLELREVGEQFIAELLGTDPTPFADLEERDRHRAIEAARTKVTNPFQHWLRLKGELMYRDMDSIETDLALFKTFVESAG
jgi:hypothetical protein